MLLVEKTFNKDTIIFIIGLLLTIITWTVNIESITLKILTSVIIFLISILIYIGMSYHNKSIEFEKLKEELDDSKDKYIKLKENRDALDHLLRQKNISHDSLERKFSDLLVLLDGIKSSLISTLSQPSDVEYTQIQNILSLVQIYSDNLKGK
ncbi:hypothetical protein ACV3RX_01340 [Clostridium perfringens]|uniref:hypothetical protein n=1 Tax=Clostridium perfringens TaxID=1502 RepID=UPI000DA34268|nr:hypothetical protein [Clostridium perfringens]EHA1005933.1 hypothetical protein [Clostridium perfringens]EHA1008915.1 hypothetical protein [Clostridium perfringens]EHA1020904.1 hypothetical protein [Clostridium perfringens]SQI03737.1 Uncharacterised protein [Clostridium perfringens]